MNFFRPFDRDTYTSSKFFKPICAVCRKKKLGDEGLVYYELIWENLFEHCLRRSSVKTKEPQQYQVMAPTD